MHRLVGYSGTTITNSPSAELFAENGQLESILIPCAAQAQPLPSYLWFWIPLGSSSVFDLEAELNALPLHQPSSSLPSSSSPLPHPFAVPIPMTQSSVSTISTSTNGGSTTDRRQQISLSRIRTFGGGSTLQIPGPISQIDSGHYVALVQNNIGYDRCTTTMYVHSTISIQMEWSSPSNSGSSPPFFTSLKSTGSSTLSNRSHVVRVIRGETVHLRCIVNGFPVNELYWLHNAVPLAMVHHKSSSSPSNSGGLSSESIQHQSSSGSNVPQSEVFNSGGSTSQTIQLYLDEQHKSGMYQCFARTRFQVVQTSVQIVIIGM